MPRKQSTKRKPTAEVEVARAVHREPVSVAMPKPAQAPRSIGNALWHFGGAMIRHHRVWLGGSASIGLVSTIYALCKSSVPVGLFAAMVGLMFVIACFYGWREQFNKALECEHEAEWLRARIANLEHPPIRVHIDNVLVAGDIDMEANQTVWTIRVTMTIIPALSRPLLLSDGCKIRMQDNSLAVDVLADFDYMYVGRDIVPFPIEVRQASKYTCEAYTRTAATDKLPECLAGVVSLRDGNSSWSQEYAVVLAPEDPTTSGRWIGVQVPSI